MPACLWYTDLTCIPYWALKTDIVGQVLGPSVFVCLCVGIGVCMFVCVWYTELRCIPYWASRTEDIMGHVLGPVCVCVCVHACMCTCVCACMCVCVCVDFPNDSLPSQ